ncbi:hypothetical protein Tco_0201570 [Tanacetum coccineum]
MNLALFLFLEYPLDKRQSTWKRIFKKRSKKKAKNKQIQAREGKDQVKSKSKVLRGEFARVKLLTLRERANRAETEGITLCARVRSLELIETWLHGIVRDEREARKRMER